MFLALKKSLTTTNNKNGFKACGIWLLNYDAMNGKIEPSQVSTIEVCLEVQVEKVLK